MSFIDKDNLTIVNKKSTLSIKKVDKIVTTIKMHVPAGEAKPIAPLAPILGQHQINGMEFCKRFNELSSIYEAGLPLPTKVLKMSNGKFDIKIEFPMFLFLLWVLMGQQFSNSVKVGDLYNLINIYAKGTNRDVKNVSRNIFGFLGSTAFKKVIV
jgi:ribosomal protein L11